MWRGHYTRTPEHIAQLRIQATHMRLALKHGPTCGCASCKGQRGEYNGEGNPRWGIHLPEELKRRIGESEKGKTVIVTPEHRKNLSKALKGKYVGENHPAWKGGRKSLRVRCPLLYTIRNHPKYIEWRKAVCDAWDLPFRCKGIQIHHLKPVTQILKDNNITTLEQALECAELWNVKNGVPLTTGEHHILSIMERHKRVSIGFLEFVQFWVNEKQPYAKNVKECLG